MTKVSCRRTMLARLGPLTRGRAALPVAGAAAVYLATAVAVTWPMPSDLRTSLYGGGGDTAGTVTDHREMAQHANPFLPSRIDSLGWPEGKPVQYPLYVSTWVAALPLWLGSLTVGAVAAMNLFVLAGFVLTGLAGFLILRWWTGDAWIALLGGWAVAFLPAMVDTAAGAPDMHHRWPLILLLWRMVVLRDDPTRRNGLLAGAAGIVAVSSNAYHLLIGTVLFAGLALAWVARAALHRRGEVRDQLRGLAWAVLPLALTAAFYAIVASTAAQSGVRELGLGQVYVYSLPPLDYLDPPPETFLLGWLDLPRVREGTPGAYVGLVLFGLALTALVLALRRVRDVRADVVALAWVAALGVVWSGPPTFQLAGVTIHLPAWFVGQLTTTWRIYGRFSALPQIAIVLLGALGLWLLVRNRGPSARAALIAAVAVLVVLDVRSPGSDKTFRESVPGVYLALRGQPPGAVAEYPLVPHGFTDYRQLYRQELHHRPLLNGYATGSRQERLAISLQRLDDRTVERLARLKVRYVVLDTTFDLYPGDPGPGPPSPTLRHIGSDGEFELYEVPGAPPVPFVE